MSATPTTVFLIQTARTINLGRQLMPGERTAAALFLVALVDTRQIVDVLLSTERRAVLTMALDETKGQDPALRTATNCCREDVATLLESALESMRKNGAACGPGDNEEQDGAV